MKEVGFSIIVATLNRHSFLMATTAGLLLQRFGGNYEVIVVDQSDKEDLEFKKLYEANENVRYFYVAHSFRGLPESRNFGCAKSRYDYLLFLDDDVEITGNNLLEEHFRYLHKEEVAIVAGGVTEKNRKNYDVKCPGSFSFFLAWPFAGFHQNESGYVTHALGANFSVKKSVFIQAGGIDEHFSVGSALGEETDFCLRVSAMGYRSFFNFNAHVTHLASPFGGCREDDGNSYCYALIHNRIIIILRFCKLYHKPIAALYSLRIIFKVQKQFHKLFFRQLIDGIKDGIRDYRNGVKHQHLEL